MWLAALRELHGRGHADAAIADQLSERYSPEFFSRHDVRHARGRQFEPPLPANGRRCEGGSIGERRRHRWGCYQRQKGWLHLLPPYDEGLTDSARGQRRRPGWELCPRQVDVLELLRTQGLLSRREIARGLGVTEKHPRLRRADGWLTPLLLQPLPEGAFRAAQPGPSPFAPALIERVGWRYRLTTWARASYDRQLQDQLQRDEQRARGLESLARRIQAGRHPSEN